MAPKGSRKVFLDSNVLLSGLFSDKGAPRIILDLLTLNLPILSGATGRYNLIEVERNLKKKMPAALPLYSKYLPKLRLEIVPLPSPGMLRKITEPIAEKDVPVLASAIACGADYFIAGDKKDFDKIKKDNRHNLVIVSPAEFVDIVVPDLIRECYESR